MEMTKQEIFNKAVRGLAAQGFERSIAPDRKDRHGEPACMYRGPNGRRCAAGQLIADEHYTPELEGRVCTSDEVRQALLCSGVPLHHVGETRYAANFVRQLQTAHDYARGPKEVKASLIELARQEGLELPEELK